MSKGRRIDVSKPQVSQPTPSGGLDQNDLIWKEGVEAVVRAELAKIRDSQPERSQQRLFLDWMLKNDLNLVASYALQSAKSRKAAIERVKSGASGSASERDPAHDASNE